MSKYGPLWQLEQIIDSKKKLIIANGEDVVRSLKKVEEAREELADYEKAIEILKAGLKEEKQNV